MLKQKNIFTFLVFVFGFLFLVFGFARAAVLYLEPSERELRPSETFIEEIKIGTEGECINAIGIDLSFSQDTLEAVDFSSGSSILTLWVKTPSIDQERGIISFAGGIPGGYCGEIPGSPGESNLLGRIIFKVKKIEGLSLEEARFGKEQPWARIKFLDSSQVLLNDGKGISARLTAKGVVFPISAKEIIETPFVDIWQEEIKEDNIPPEEFSPEITSDPAVFEGKYFLTFSATDKQTGIDYYEVAELKRLLLFFWREGEWKKAQSPYLLKDQGLRSKILVKAVDKAGNTRIETVMPKIHWKDVLSWVIILLVVAMVIWWLTRKLKIKNQKPKIKT